MSGVIWSFLGTLITGIIVIVGYIVQKRFEHINSVNDKKLTIYSNYLRSHWQLQDPNENNATDALHYKSLMILFASDSVLLKFNRVNRGVIARENLDPYLERKHLFDELFLEMRKDILKKTRARLDDIHYCSPYLPDEKYKTFIHN